MGGRIAEVEKQVGDLDAKLTKLLTHFKLD